MAPPAYSMSPYGGYMRSNGYPPIPPPASLLYRNLRIPAGGLGWPTALPRIPRAQNPPIRPKKIICIQDPATGVDVTEEILSSATSSLASKRSQSVPAMSPPIKVNGRRIPPMSVSLGFVRKPPPPPTHPLLKPFRDEDYLWPEEELSDGEWNDRDIFADGLVGCSWPPVALPWMKRSWGNTPGSQRPQFEASLHQQWPKKYTRDHLMLLRYHPSAMIEPAILENWPQIRAKNRMSAPVSSAASTVANFPACMKCPRCGQNKAIANAMPLAKPHSKGKQVKKQAKKESPKQKESPDGKLDRGDYSFDSTSSPKD